MKIPKFHLTELLILVAIIGVLVAVSIPIFTSQLEKSRDAVTLSNIRAAYAQAQTAYLTQDTTSTEAKYTAGSEGTATVVVTGVEAKGTSGTIDNFDQLPFADAAKTSLNTEGTMGGTPKKYDLTFNYNKTGVITSVTCAASK